LTLTLTLVRRAAVKFIHTIRFQKKLYMYEIGMSHGYLLDINIKHLNSSSHQRAEWSKNRHHESSDLSKGLKW